MPNIYGKIPVESRDIDHVAFNQLSKNLEFRKKGRESPGPANYTIDVPSNYSRNHIKGLSKSMVTIPKQKRHLSNVKVDNFIGPNSYETLDKIALV